MAKKHSIYISALCGLLALLILMPVLSILFGAAQAGAVSQWEIDQLKEQRAEIEEQQNALQGEIDELESQQADVMSQKAALDEQNELTRQEIELINEQIALYEKLIAAKEMELEEAIEAERAQMEAYRAHMRAMEENGVISYIEILFQARSFSDLLSRIDDISDIMEADKRLEDECIAAKETVQRVKAEYEETQAEYEATKVELLAKKAQLEADIEAACKLIADLEDHILERQEEYDAMEAEMAQVSDEITEMLLELQRQEELAKQNGGSGVVSTGSYIWPLPGYSAGSRTFGTQFHPIDKVWKTHSGQDIGAPNGTTIIAADSGTVSVASTGWNGGYGNYVMIDHGGGRATLYAHMSSIAVTAGSSISQGDIVGYVGSTGKSTGPHLHFEVRINGAAVDPMQYFA